MQTYLQSLFYPLYTSTPYTLYTQLSVDECLRRLRDDVRRPILTTWQSGGYTPLAAVTDQEVLRKLDGGTRFIIQVGFPSYWDLWQFRGVVQARGDHTVIEGQYRLHSISRFAELNRWVLALVFIGLFLVVSIVGFWMEILLWWQALLLIAVACGSVWFLVNGVRNDNASAREREKLIIVALCSTLDATEAPQLKEPQGERKIA